ncbi:glycoside hydrolase [Ceraceosorus guamensis]|uniref:glucan 1,3-beta-glucosidase n=1 Tax=Ceraceosorus guamensis TaxID=1522189 RepID=A0A316W5N6_9BASI|nr:glycoside hydrolase [Ceraceosorus guamensis]PWN44031.1 glycoside hydrolase [Ceraceosorus guamensis]
MGGYEKGSWTPDAENATSAAYADAATKRPGLDRYGRAGAVSHKKRWLMLAGVAAVLALLVVAIVVPITQILLKDDKGSGSQSDEAGTTQTDSSGHGTGGKVLTSGTNGSVIDLGNGQSFTYINNFGGSWRSGILDDGAQAQSYTKPLNQQWDWAADQQLGVNLGGWLVIEPFIVPGLFEPYENTSTPVVDEWGLAQRWQSEGRLEQNYRQHYDTFVTERDFADIAAAGLNWVRLPVGYWALDVEEDEPFLAHVSWEYFLKAIQWARKYGLRINLDLHSAPGQQNEYNHSGRLGRPMFLNSPQGIVYGQRGLNVLRQMIQFISQDEVKNVVPMLSVLNEPNLNTGIGRDGLNSWHQEVYSMMRNITGTGAGRGPFMVISDGFLGIGQSVGYMSGADRIGIDVHKYIAFTPPFSTNSASGALAVTACNGYRGDVEQGLTQFGLTMVGEWSLALNDCGLFLNGVTDGVRYDGSYNARGQTATRQGDCPYWDDWENFSAEQKTSLRQTALAQMDAYHNFYFWTWKIGNSLRTGKPVNPNWSYQLGLQNGWMPTDPRREAQNYCRSLQSTFPSITGTAFTSWSSTFSNWMTGAASTFSPPTASYAWPPQSIASSGTVPVLAVSTLAQLTPTGSIQIPPTPTFSATFRGEAVPTLGAIANPSYSPGFYVQASGGNARRDLLGAEPVRRAAAAPVPTPAPLLPRASSARSHPRDVNP